MITKRPRRLPGVSYVGFQRYFLTICTAHRSRAFACGTTVEAALRDLRHAAAALDFQNTAYCFMPDHLHLLATATACHADLREFVRRFKQVSAFHYKAANGSFLWQPGYHERILRDDESTDAVVRYTLENPIRAGLATALGEYPWAGSDVYDLAALLTAWGDERGARGR